MRGPEEDLANYRLRAFNTYLKRAEDHDEEARYIGEDERPGSQFGMVSTICEFSAAACRFAADQCRKAATEDEVDAVAFASRMLTEKLNAAIGAAPANTSEWAQ